MQNNTSPQYVLDVGQYPTSRIDEFAAQQNMVTEWGGVVALNLTALDVVGSVAIGPIDRDPQAVECFNEFDRLYGTGTCWTYVHEHGVDCTDMLCPTCDFANRCDLLCGFCSPELINQTSLQLHLEGIRVTEDVVVHDVAVHEAVSVLFRDLQARQIVVDGIIPTENSDEVPSGQSIMWMSNCSAAVIDITLPPIQFESLEFSQLVVGDEFSVDAQQTAVSRDVTFHNIARPT